MGRRKFRFSDMMPNSWFYKLRDMRRAGGRSAAGGASVTSSSLGGKGSTHQAGTPRPVPAPLPHRTSYYYASMDRLLQPPQPTWAAAEDGRRQFVPQTKSPSRRHRTPPLANAKTVPELVPVAQAPGARHRRRDTCIVGGDGTADVVGELRDRAVEAPSSKDTFSGKVIASDTDIIFDLRADDMPAKRLLRPIVTRPARKKQVDSRYEPKERRRAVAHRGAVTPRPSSESEQGVISPRRSSVSVSSGRRLKTRVKSPRLSSRCRKGGKSANPATAASSARKATARASPPPLQESFAVVKKSVDPRNDFRESMEEMIAEQGIRDAGDLEDLLACYLTLNVPEHHDVIIEVFEEIWVSLTSFNNL